MLFLNPETVVNKKPPITGEFPSFIIHNSQFRILPSPARLGSGRIPEVSETQKGIIDEREY
jgi:hypothetical protein